MHKQVTTHSLEKKKAHRTVGEQSCHLSTHQQTRTHTRTHTQTGSKISQRHFTKKPNKQPTEQTVPLAELISAATMPLKGAAETQTDEADLDPSQVLSNHRLRANFMETGWRWNRAQVPRSRLSASRG